MTWYLVVDQDNNLVSSGSRVADSRELEKKGLTVIERDEKPPEGAVWDKVSRDMVVPAKKGDPPDVAKAKEILAKDVLTNTDMQEAMKLVLRASMRIHDV